jgi:phage terminase large subunit-like protein
MTNAPPKTHPTTRYTEAVASGEIVAGRLVRMACERHLRDLDRQGSPEFPYWFDEERASQAFDFFEFELHHYEGDLDGEPFMLLGWQMFVIGSLYGWVDSDGNRRFRTAFVLTGKGSGKTPMFAGICLRGLIDDDEPGAQVFAAATTREQAALAFKDAKAMARKSPNIRGKVHVTEHAITFENSYFQTVSSEAGNLHGKRPHVGLIDEIHVHADDGVVEALRAGTKGRRQALMLMPTNAGQDRRSLAWRYQEYSARVLSGAATDEQWFAYVCQLDVCEAHRSDGKDMPVDDCKSCDQWPDEAVWPKANPSLPVVPGYRYLREQVNEAIGMPAKQDIVKRLNMCIWTSGKVQWIRPEMWESQAAPKGVAKGQRCFVGIDLAAVNDIAAMMLWFPDEDGAGGDLMAKLYLPEERVDELATAGDVPYRQWAAGGFITLTPGHTINYDFIEEDFFRLASEYQVQSSGIDPWQSIQFRAHLEARDVPIVTIPQTNQRLHAVVEETERLMALKGLRHGGNPVLRWIASNCVLSIDSRGMKRLDKQKSPAKIDPLAALLNALSEAMVFAGDEGPSVYETRGLISL